MVTAVRIAKYANKKEKNLFTFLSFAYLSIFIFNKKGQKEVFRTVSGVTKTTRYKNMMVLLGQCGFVSRPDRLRVMSKVLGKDISTFTSLTSQDVDKAIESLSTWKMLQTERFTSGIILEESFLYVQQACNTSMLTVSDNDILPNEASRRKMREFIMSAKNFTTDKQDINDRLQAYASKNSDSVDVVKVDPDLGRKPSGEVIPAPVVSLGLAFGTGGLPRGSVMHVYGEKHSGKTLLSSHMIAEAQRCGIPTILIDMEAAADGAFLASAGVDVDDLNIIVPHDLETMAEILRDFSDSGALIVVDSIAAAESRREFERNISKESPRVGGNAMLWKSTLNLFRPGAKKNGTTLVLINQVRANMNAGMMGNPLKAYGTEAIQHNSDISIRVSPIKEKNDTLKNKGYKRSRFKFEKNRNSGQLDTIDVCFKPGYPYDRSIDIVRSCSSEIEQNNPVTYGELSGMALAADTMYNDKEEKFDKKKNRFAIAIDKYMMAAIQLDDPEFAEVDIEPAESYDGIWDSDSPAPDIDTEGIVAGFTLPGVGEVNAMKWLKKHPAARDLISERMLNGLNRKNDYIKEL